MTSFPQFDLQATGTIGNITERLMDQNVSCSNDNDHSQVEFLFPIGLRTFDDGRGGFNIIDLENDVGTAFVCEERTS